MVAVLLSTACITADRLQMTVLSWANPYILIDGGNRQLANAGQGVFIGDLAAIGRAIFEPLAVRTRRLPGARSLT